MQSTTTPSTSAKQPYTSRRKAFQAGLLAILPLIPAAAPFGMIYAVTAIAAGLSAPQTLVMSLIVFAGAAQFTAAGLFAAGVAGPAIVVATAIINARHLLMSASLTPYLRKTPAYLRALLAFQLTDETYALGVSHFLRGEGSPHFLLGANIGLYIVWQLSTLAGIAIGGFIPDPAAYGLDLIFPLTFIGLLVPLLRDRLSASVALLGGGLALIGALWLPGSWYLLVAGGVASGLGSLFIRRQTIVEEV